MTLRYQNYNLRTPKLCFPASVSHVPILSILFMTALSRLLSLTRCPDECVSSISNLFTDATWCFVNWWPQMPLPILFTFLSADHPSTPAFPSASPWPKPLFRQPSPHYLFISDLQGCSALEYRAGGLESRLASGQWIGRVKDSCFLHINVAAQQDWGHA